ncbi:MAG: M20/M25/M40 family metallo-hydrolase [Gemmatimonadota bacterium]|nr:M20/M25/M40 family metallo-hydrolase [Gemmatimonadota bacterium]MDH4348985.1 M20/M25/M40 family metallo-hydrolase [Gemmatimonadota bacterium]MDH5282706.1 M20/M25/M40 family metallo-hydrolase [Gemmatimonadota bacterium]
MNRISRTRTPGATQLWAAALLATGCGSAAGTPASPAPAAGRGAESITAEDVRRRIFLIADDSMGGRGTPSPGLEKMANYAASEFRRLGLEPGGESGTFFQRYPIEVWQSFPDSSGVWSTGRATADWKAGADFAVQGGQVEGEITAGVTLIAGDPLKGVAVDSQAVTGQVIVLGIGPHTNASAGVLLPLRPAVAIAVLPDSVFPMVSGQSTIQVKGPQEDGGLALPPIIYVRESTFSSWLGQVGIGASALQSDEGLKTLPVAGVTLRVRSVQRLMEKTTAPNVIGIVRGTDPVLKDEYVVYSAHMDHIGTASGGQGCAAKGADTICNGADDDGSGTVAVLELAEAFATAPVKPKRSIVFITVSGEERGLWGSAYFANHPTIPLPSIIANLNSDMVGRSDTLKDSMAVIGRQHSDLGATLDRVATANPALRMTALDDPWPQEGLYSRSDHFSFAQKGVPVLFFTSGLHPDYHGAGDTPDKIDWDKVARFTRLAYQMGMDIANTAERPKWDPASYQKYVGGGGQ